jgi:hypothetical protein
MTYFFQNSIVRNYIAMTLPEKRQGDLFERYWSKIEALLQEIMRILVIRSPVSVYHTRWTKDSLAASEVAENRYRRWRVISQQASGMALLCVKHGN